MENSIAASACGFYNGTVGRKRVIALMPGILCGMLVLLVGFSPHAEFLENAVFDRFTRWSEKPSKWPKDVVVIVIDDNSLGYFNARHNLIWPWSRSAFGFLTAVLTKAGAHSIAFDMVFTEQRDSLEDDQFAAFLKNHPRVWLGVAHAKGEKKEVLGPTKSLLAAVDSRVGLVNALKDRDGVIRRYPCKDLWLQSDKRPLALCLAEPKDLPRGDAIRLRWYGSYESIPEDQVIPIHRVLADAALWFEGALKEARKQKEFDETEPADALKLIQQMPENPALKKLLSGKRIFVGTSATMTLDQVATPVARQTLGLQPGVMVHATALSNLMRGDYFRDASVAVRGCLGFLICFYASFFWSNAWRLRWQLIGSLGILFSALLLSWICFQNNFWLPPAWIIVAGMTSLTASAIYQYFVEGKQRREIKQLFSDFVSPDVLDELLLSSELDLLGGTRSGTVLFCDLAGFTTLMEKAEPKASFDAINTYLAEASRILMARSAYVNKFIGDAVMAVFNIPKLEPRHAAQACLAALELQKMIDELNRNVAAKYQLKLELRTGINSGSMIAGALGYSRKREYGVLGDTVNLASRLEGANKPYHTHTMIGPETYEQAKDEIEARPLDLLRVKGKFIPVPVYEVLAPKGGLTEVQKKVCEAYLKGFELYRQRRWNEAEKQFDAALSMDPNDGPSQIYKERCRAYAVNPPPADWDGSFGLDTK